LEGVIDPIGADLDRKEKLQQFNILFADTIEKKKKELSLIPIYRTIEETGAGTETIFLGFGYKMILPWDNHTTKHHLDYCAYIVSPKEWLVVIENPRDSIGTTTFQQFRSEAWFDYLFYDIPQNNQFEFVKSILKANPADLNKIHDQGQIYYKKVQLIIASLLKPLFMPGHTERDDYVDSIYYFTLPNVKGFQIGKPEKDKITRLVLYPEDNKEIHIIVYEGENGHVTQDHIDFMIRNFEQNSLKG